MDQVGVPACLRSHGKDESMRDNWMNWTRLEKHQPLTVSKKRGRPKKAKRIESQVATEAFKTKLQQVHYMQ